MSKPFAIVVDDDRGIVAGVKMRLAHAGYDVECAHDGIEGFEMIRSQHPDVALLDVRMPGRDGLEVLQQLRVDPETASIPVIMLSASLRDRNTAFESGAQFFLTKPYRSQDLLEALSSVATGAGDDKTTGRDATPRQADQT